MDDCAFQFYFHTFRLKIDYLCVKITSMDSLYVIVLQYLRRNYRLINFTVLSDEIAEDVFAIMSDPYHLSICADVKCRREQATYGIDPFIVEHYPDSKWVVEIKSDEMNRFDMMRAGVDGSRFRMTNYGCIYDALTDKFYNVNRSFIRPYKHGIYKSEFNVLTCSDSSEDNCDSYDGYDSDNSSIVDPYEQIHIVEDRAFDEFPGLIEWIENNMQFAEQLLIPRRILIRLPFRD